MRDFTLPSRVCQDLMLSRKGLASLDSHIAKSLPLLY